jgi:hypothetical protein
VTARTSKVKTHFTKERITLDLVERGIFEDLKLRKEEEGEGKRASYIYSQGT